MIAKALALKLLETSAVRPEAFEWSLQGFGMLRLYLSKAIRLHVWDDRYAVPNVTTIHTHPWHFKSTVLFGCITDVFYKAEEVNSLQLFRGDEAPTHDRKRIVCGPGGGATSAPSMPVRLKEIARVPIFDDYTLRAHDVHESVPERHTVTVIEREFLPDTEHAYVFVPIGKTWISAEPREATPAEVRKICGDAFEKWRTR